MHVVIDVCVVQCHVSVHVVIDVRIVLCCPLVHNSTFLAFIVWTLHEHTRQERRLKDLLNEFAALRTSESVCRFTGY